MRFDVSPVEEVFELLSDRATCTRKDLSNRFRHTKKDFARQYAHIYSTRLLQMKDCLVKSIEQKWGTELPVKRLADLQEDVGARCIIIGTLFKDQELRPTILKEISDELQIVPQKKLVRFVSDSDRLILEDELQRIVLIGNIDVHSLVTGIVCAVLGKENSLGKFEVEDICFPGPQAPLLLSNHLTEEKYILMLSGLNLATSTCLPNLQILVQWASGWLGSDQSKVALVLVAGGLLRSSSEETDGKIINSNIETSSDIITAIGIADDILSELSETMNVELMPGEYDPTNYLMPQQPIHFRMFPKAMKNKTFNGGTNPHCFQMDNIVVLGSSGQPVTDLGKYSNISDPLEALEATFRWGHMAPTAPDSLGCFPYFDKDPFIIEEQPHIYFSSNHDSFQTKIINYNYGNGISQDTRLICVPSFSKTSTAVLVNISDLECRPFKIDLS